MWLCSALYKLETHVLCNVCHESLCLLMPSEYYIGEFGEFECHTGVHCLYNDALCRPVKRGPGLLQLDEQEQQMINKRRLISSFNNSKATLNSAMNRQLNTITPLRGCVSISTLHIVVLVSYVCQLSVYYGLCRVFRPYIFEI